MISTRYLRSKWNACLTLSQMLRLCTGSPHHRGPRSYSFVPFYSNSSRLFFTWICKLLEGNIPNSGKHLLMVKRKHREWVIAAVKPLLVTEALPQPSSFFASPVFPSWSKPRSTNVLSPWHIGFDSVFALSSPTRLQTFRWQRLCS